MWNLVSNKTHNELRDIIDALNYILIYLSSIERNGEKIIGQDLTNAFNWTSSSYSNNPFDIRWEEWLIIYNKDLRDHFKQESANWVLSIDSKFARETDRINKHLSYKNFKKSADLKRKLITWLGFENKIKLDGNKITYTSSDKTLSTGWSNLVNKIINPLTDPDLWESKTGVLLIDDPTDTLDYFNVFSVSSAIRNIENIIGNGIWIKKVIFTNNELFVKRYSKSIGSDKIQNLTRNYETNTFDIEEIKSVETDFVYIAYNEVKQNIAQVNNPLSIINNLRIINEWIKIMFNDEQYMKLLSWESYVFSVNYFNARSHHNNEVPILNDDITERVKNFIKDIEEAFPKKFKIHK